MNKKLINVVKGDINTALENGNYNRNTTYQTNIEFNTPTKLILLDGIPYSSPLLTKVTWQELKNKRDAGELTPGALYRITDYQCTTTQESTKSAGHQFDIVLLALSENKLAEEGWAMNHGGVDMFNDYDIYTITFNDGVSKQVYYKVIPNPSNNSEHRVVDTKTFLGFSLWHNPIEEEFVFDHENKTATNNYLSSTEFESYLQTQYPYNYFQNSNLSAWKVWYSLDNDKSRFAWADDSVDEGSPASIEVNGGEVFERSEVDDVSRGEFRYAWRLGDFVIYTQNTTPSQGDNGYFNPDGTGKPAAIEQYNAAHEGTGLPNGRGVIYRLIDEWNNDIKYDFKNIQFKRKLTNGQYNANGTETWCYTLNLWYNDMCQDASIVGNTLPNDDDYISGVYDNKFGYATAYDLYLERVSTFTFALGNNVILSFVESGAYFGIYSNTIGTAFCNNTIGAEFYSNTIGNGFIGNTIGNSFNNNMIGNVFTYKTISDNTTYKNYGNNGVELATKS